MLQITIPAMEFYDERKDEIFSSPERLISLEHSLLSLHKWEKIWHKPFLDKEQNMTMEQTISYVKCMCMTQSVPEECFLSLMYNPRILEEINRYIADPMTATTFSNYGKEVGNKIITAEIIYHQMIANSIPFECQKWHLNSLLTLIHVCNAKNSSDQKLSKSEVYERQRAIRAANREKMKKGV